MTEEQVKACFQKCGVAYPESLEDFENEYYEDGTDAEENILNELFGSSKRHFTISIGIKNLLTPISHEEHIVVRKRNNCYCYEKKTDDDLFLIRRKHQNINSLTIIDELTKQGFKPCNHAYFEGVDYRFGEYVLIFGS